MYKLAPLPFLMAEETYFLSSFSVGNGAAISSLYKKQDPDRIYNGVKRKNSCINMNKFCTSCIAMHPPVHSCSAVYRITIPQ